MNLLRLPFVVLIEVFKNMNFEEIFLISLLSKRARNTLKITCVIPHFAINLSDGMYIHVEHYISQSRMTGKVFNYLIGAKKMRFSLYPDGISLQEKLHEKQFLLIEHLLDTFPKSTISITFSYKTLPALEFMKIFNQRGVSIKSFSYCISGDSSEFNPKILDECTEVTEHIFVSANFPDNYVYTPPRPFKAKKVCVWENSNWLNLEEFMSCRCISLELGENSNRTAKTYNSFFTKWMDSGAPLQEVKLVFFGEPDYRMIMSAFRNHGTERRINNDWFEINRKDGFFMGTFGNYIIVCTKQAYLEKFRENEAGIQY
uniref:F-box domain-containing protein n=1 Tax=Caenorhabditis tropicalis TaxID=1561998 RepID=A0A1I7UTN2_9PELO